MTVTIPAAAASSSTKGALVHIATISLTANGGFAFSNIPQTFQDLYLIGYLRSAYTSSTLDVVLLDFGYTQEHSYTAVRGSGSGTTDSYRGITSYGLYCNSVPTTLTSANIFGIFEAHILNYTNNGNYKTALVRQSFENGTTGGNSLTVGSKRSVAAQSPLTFVELGGGNAAIAAGSVLSLYGVRTVKQ